MTNTIAFVLAGLIFALMALDYTQNNAELLTFLARKMLDLVEYVTFWR